MHWEGMCGGNQITNWFQSASDNKCRSSNTTDREPLANDEIIDLSREVVTEVEECNKEYEGNSILTSAQASPDSQFSEMETVSLTM